eukprot:s605_g16.t1
MAPKSMKKPVMKVKLKKNVKAKAAPCQKGKAKAQPKKKSALTKGKLAKLGKLTLDEKVKLATEEAENEEQAAITLKQSLTKDESAKMWSKHQTYLKTHPEEKEEHQTKSKTEKGLEVVLWFLKHNKGKFFHTEASKEASETLTKSQEREVEDEEDVNQFTSFWGKGSAASLQEAEVSFKGKGQPALTKGKGSKGSRGNKGGKGRGRGQLALEDGDPNEEDEKPEKTEEEQWAECLTKAQKSKEQLLVAMANLEEAVEAANKAGRTSKQDRKEATLSLKDMQLHEAKLKAITSKRKGGNVENAKEVIKAAVAATNKMKSEVKDFKALANKTFSKASSRK